MEYSEKEQKQLKTFGEKLKAGLWKKLRRRDGLLGSTYRRLSWARRILPF